MEHLGVTTLVRQSTATYHEEDTSEEDTSLLILKILVYGVTPVISVFGLCGNVMSIVILKRHGLHKCSNILLVSLAVCDICFLVGFNNVPKALYDINGNGRFLYSRNVGYCLYVVYYVMTIFDYDIGFVGLTIPVFITVERFVAVYFPLRMSKIVTPRRTWFVIIVVVIYGVFTTSYACAWNQYEYVFDPVYNRTVGRITKSSLFYRDEAYRLVMDEIHISVKIQPVVTFVGCVLIIIKVKLASIKRKKMTSSTGKAKSAVSKTTQTLMVVSVVYLLVCAILALPSILPEDVLHYSLSTGKNATYLNLIFYQLMNIALCINSSWNFIIYIIFNKKFRDTFNQIVGTKSRRST